MVCSPDLLLDTRQGTDEQMLAELMRETFDFFLQDAAPGTGLIPDSTQPHAPCSVAGMGLTLSAYTVAERNHIISRDDAVKRTLRVLRFFAHSTQGPQTNATGYRGFYYHFIDCHTGARAWQSEVSTIDTALFIAGALNAAQYFDREHKGEAEIRKLADELYRRIDWQWALDGQKTISHGWKPEIGFLPSRWDRGYNESMILYVLALGSPTFPIDPRGYTDWTSTFELRGAGSERHAYAGPLFIHQMSQLWLGLKDLRDDFGRREGLDYFENSRRATYAQRQYAIANPHGFAHYGELGWGFTASDGPGPTVLEVEGRRRKFYGYIARGAPDDIDDGTISPWAAVTSLPFAPEIVLRTIRHAIERLRLKNRKRVGGFDASFNPTYPVGRGTPVGWVSPWRFVLNQGPIILMIENYRSGLIWNSMAKCPYVVTGLHRAGFRPTAPDVTDAHPG